MQFMVCILYLFVSMRFAFAHFAARACLYRNSSSRRCAQDPNLNPSSILRCGRRSCASMVRLGEVVRSVVGSNDAVHYQMSKKERQLELKARTTRAHLQHCRLHPHLCRRQ
jgi:hypothetical protein